MAVRCSDPVTILTTKNSGVSQPSVPLETIKLPQNLLGDFSCLIVLIMCAKWMALMARAENAN